MLVLFIGIFYNLSHGQKSCALNGVVVGKNNETLTGALVVLHAPDIVTISDEKGVFSFSDLPGDTYVIEISFIGYTSLVDTLLIDGNNTYTAHLEIAPMSLQEIVITDNYAEQRKNETSLNVEVVNEEYLKQNLGGSLMNSLERLPGVTTIDIGSGQAKPVIRGLGFNRVVVVENNIKHEAQQWGSDHGLEIDQYSVDNVEVIKGPASLMYGSDAIGGVIDMNNRKIPANYTLEGALDLTGKSNNELLGASLSLQGRKNWFFAGIRATYIDYGDYKVPTNSIDIYSYKADLHNNYLRNTAGYEKNMHLSFGVIQNKFQSKFHVSSVNSKSGFFANAHGIEPRNVDTELHDKSNRDINYPYQKVNHFKLINTSHYQWESTKLEFDLGVQRNFRQERSQYVQHGHMPPVFPDTLDFDSDLERAFDKYVYSGNVKLSHRFNKRSKLIIGANGEYQNNDIDGRGFIIPAFRQLALGAFVFGRYTISDKSGLQYGVRFDYGNLKTDDYFDWYPSPIDEDDDTKMENLQRAEHINRKFSNFTWSLGYNYNAEQWQFKTNVGKSFRMPIAKELAANGVNYHRFSYEVGDVNLSPEISYQLDLGLEYHANSYALGVTPFVNYFSNYIYLNPSSEHDRLYGNGNQVFYYTESEVFRFGGEIHGHVELLKHLRLGIIGEYVYSEQLSGEKKGYTLPFSPPASAIFNVKYQKMKFKFITKAYFSLDYRVTASQTNIVPPEVATDGFQLINIGLGGNVEVGKRKVNISMQVQNLMNTKYFNHTSFYRLINVPEAGRNFIVNISLPISGKIK